MKRDENGYIVVETVGAFIPFVFLVVSILSLVNIVTLQARVHYALTQTANSLSMYCYLFEVLDMADGMSTLNSKADVVAREANAMRDDIKAVFNGIDSLAGIEDAADAAGDIADRTAEWAKLADDPKALAQLAANYGLEELRSVALEMIARPLVGRYLSNGEMTGDEYLRSVGVKKRGLGSDGLEVRGLAALEFHQWGNLGLGNSVLIDMDGNVKLTVEYEVAYTFGALPLPFKPTIRITQTAVTKAWLSGSGEGYW